LAGLQEKEEENQEEEEDKQEEEEEKCKECSLCSSSFSFQSTTEFSSKNSALRGKRERGANTAKRCPKRASTSEVTDQFKSLKSGPCCDCILSGMPMYEN
jgi:hypothetical protein